MSSMKEELEIEIDETGKVTIHVHGIKGKSCVEKAQQLAAKIGNIEEQSFTAEYYQPGASVSITDMDRTKIK